MSFPRGGGCGQAVRTASSRCCGENAPAHGLRGGWGGPSAANETGLTDCTAVSYSDGRDERDPLSAASAGRERPPRKRPSLAQPGISERSLPGIFLAGRQWAAGSFGEARYTRGSTDRTPFRGIGLGLRYDDDADLQIGGPERFSTGIGQDTVMLRCRTSTLQTSWRFGFI